MMLSDLYVYMSLSINVLFCHTSVIFTFRQKRAAGELDFLYISKILLIIIKCNFCAGIFMMQHFFYCFWVVLYNMIYSVI